MLATASRKNVGKGFLKTVAELSFRSGTPAALQWSRQKVKYDLHCCEHAEQHSSLFDLGCSSDDALASGTGWPCSRNGSLDFMAECTIFVLVPQLIKQDSLP